MKPREERQKVMIRGRMRTGAAWNDVCIVNLSKRGVGIQAADPPSRGTYVEICRGRQVIVARVVWTKGHRAGLQSQDLIWVQALINEASAANDRSSVAPGSAPVERRRAPRTGKRHDQSRIVARAMEAACIAIVGLALGMGAFGMVQEAFAQPLAQIGAALG